MSSFHCIILRNTWCPFVPLLGNVNCYHLVKLLSDLFLCCKEIFLIINNKYFMRGHWDFRVDLSFLPHFKLFSFFNLYQNIIMSSYYFNLQWKLLYVHTHTYSYIYTQDLSLFLFCFNLVENDVRNQTHTSIAIYLSILKNRSSLCDF